MIYYTRLYYHIIYYKIPGRSRTSSSCSRPPTPGTSRGSQKHVKKKHNNNNKENEK